MVVFTCNNCGDSLQKPKVEKHYATTCRTLKNLTCVDCLKDFKEEDYVGHIKCVSEKERYAAKGSVVNVVNKGEVKQQQWSDLIVEVLNSKTDLPAAQKLVFDLVSNQIINVPRKKLKFMNFIKNCGGNRVMYSDIEQAWDIIEEYKTTRKSKPEEATPIDETNTETSKKKKKSKKATEETENGQENDEPIQSENVNEPEDKPKKKKKSKGKKNDEKTAEDTTTIKRKLEEETAPEVTSPKKKKKSKQQPENGVAENGHNEEEVKGTNGNDNTEELNESISNGNAKKEKKKKNKVNQLVEEAKMDVSTDSPNESANLTTDSVTNGTENLSDKILKLLKKKGSSSLSKLQKKVLKEYCQENGVEENPKLVKKFNKQLKKIECIEVTDDNVRLIQA